MTILYQNPIVGILKLMMAHGEEIDNRIRIQKSVFLLKRAGMEEFGRLRFSYHHFGPYSHQLSDVIQDLVAANLMSEERIPYKEDQVRYHYRLTQEGSAWLTSNYGLPSSDLKQHVGLLKTAHWRALELASTALFLLDEGSADGLANAFVKALDLKPACRAFREEAEQLISAFN